MIAFVHFIFCALQDFFTPSWQKDVRSISREVVLKLFEDFPELKAQSSHA